MDRPWITSQLIWILSSWHWCTRPNTINKSPSWVPPCRRYKWVMPWAFPAAVAPTACVVPGDMSTSMSSRDREEERSALTYLTCYMQYIHRQPFTGHHRMLMRYIWYKIAQLLESCYLIPSVIVCIVAYRCCWQSRGGFVLCVLRTHPLSDTDMW